MADDAYREVTFAAPDGLKLYARVYEPGKHTSAIPLACLPGLTRNSRDFHELALFLAQHPETPRRVISFDYRGRGFSAYDRDWSHYNIGTEANDVSAGLSAIGVNRAIVLGTSRGGLIAHILMATAPQLLAGVILNDIGPEIAPEGLRQIAQYLQKRHNPRTWPEAVEHQRSIHGAAFPALAEADWKRFVHAIYRRQRGTIRPDFDPNLVKTMANIDYSQKLPDLWPQFELFAKLALLVIRGENTPLLTRQTLQEMSRRHPAMQVINVPGQGHAPLLETGQLPELIAAFAAGIDLRG